MPARTRDRGWPGPSDRRGRFPAGPSGRDSPIPDATRPTPSLSWPSWRSGPATIRPLVWPRRIGAEVGEGVGAMPNGGSDCCGTCWFNRANGGEPGSANHNHEIPSYCEIRELEIPVPFYTYCANHPYHRPQRDPIPIGPVTVHEGESVESEPGHHEIRSWREPWRQSPDTEVIRRHLLSLLEDPGAATRRGLPFLHESCPLGRARSVDRVPRATRHPHS